MVEGSQLIVNSFTSHCDVTTEPHCDVTGHPYKSAGQSRGAAELSSRSPSAQDRAVCRQGDNAHPTCGLPDEGTARICWTGTPVDSGLLS